MYDNIGKKVKALAKFIFIVEAIGAVIAGIVMMLMDDGLILYGLLAAFCGPIVAWVSSWILYAFGELVDDTHVIRCKYYPVAEEEADRVVEEDAEEEVEASLESVKRAKQEHEKTVIAPSNTPRPKVKKTEEPTDPLPCPECGEDLSFMGWSDSELKEKQSCPLCGKDVYLKHK